jgi:hypothetical protein
MFVHIAVTAVIRPFFGGRGFVVKKCNLKKQGLAAVDADMHAEEAQLLQQLAAAVTATAGSSSHAGAGVRASNSAPPLMPPISPSQSVDSQSVNSAPGCAQLPRPRGRPPPRPWRGPPPLCLDTARPMAAMPSCGRWSSQHRLARLPSRRSSGAVPTRRSHGRRLPRRPGPRRLRQWCARRRQGTGLRGGRGGGGRWCGSRPVLPRLRALVKPSRNPPPPPTR